MTSLVELRNNVTNAFVERGRGARVVSIYFKIVFVAGAAAIAGIAQFMTWDAGGYPTASQAVGILATFFVFLAASYSVFQEKDAGEHLALAHAAISRGEELAREAIDRADAERERLRDIFEEIPDIEPHIALYMSTKVMRNVLEQACVAMTGDEETLVSVLTKVAAKQLAIAAGFSLRDQYTICVYKALQNQSDCRFELHLVEHIRAIECEKATARTWPEGKGVAGVAFTNAKEILIEDLSVDGIRAVFQPDGLGREYDDDRYRSIIAVPIQVAGNDRPWGIVTATNDRPEHFNHLDQPGLKPEEAIRALANYVALAVAMMEVRERAKNPAPQVA